MSPPQEKSERTHVRFDDKEKAMLEVLAELEGVTTSDVIRMAVRDRYRAKFGDEYPLSSFQLAVLALARVSRTDPATLRARVRHGYADEPEELARLDATIGLLRKLALIDEKCRITEAGLQRLNPRSEHLGYFEDSHGARYAQHFYGERERAAVIVGPIPEVRGGPMPAVSEVHRQPASSAADARAKLAGVVRHLKKGSQR